MRLQASRAVVACESLHAAFGLSLHGCVQYLPAETYHTAFRDLRLPRKVKSAIMEMRSRKALPIHHIFLEAQT